MINAQKVIDSSERNRRRKQWWSEHLNKTGKNKDESDLKEGSKEGLIKDKKQTDTCFNLKDFSKEPTTEETTKRPASEEIELEKSAKKVKSDSTLSELTKSQKRRLRNKKITEINDTNEIKTSVDCSTSDTNSCRIKVENKIKKKKKHRGSKNKTEISEKLFTLYVGGMGPDTTKDEIKFHFGDKIKNNIEGIRLLTHKDSKKSKGLAFVDFKTKEFMKEALLLNKSVLFKKTITVQLPVPGKKAEKGPNPLRKPKTSKDATTENQ